MGEGAGAQNHGRPHVLDDRLAAISSVLAQEGLSHPPSTMHCMAWWEESMSAALGCGFDTVGFARGPGRPHSGAVEAVLGRWRSEGQLSRHADYDAELSEDENVAIETLNRGRAPRGRASEISS